VTEATLGAQFSSATGLWRTPQWLFDELDAEFGFGLDVCATGSDAKCSVFYTPEQDGLKQEWRGVCWCNPPFGRGIGEWVKKAYGSSRDGSVVVCLLPVRSDTEWWHRWVMQASEIRFVRGRVHFDMPEGVTMRGHNCPFPSAIVVFRPISN
jgi:phage N-6-adenine-methyltransferase